MAFLSYHMHRSLKPELLHTFTVLTLPFDKNLSFFSNMTLAFCIFLSSSFFTLLYFYIRVLFTVYEYSYGSLTNAYAYVSGCSFVPDRPSCSAEQPCLTTPMEQANTDHQNVKSHKGVCSVDNGLTGPVQQQSDSSHSCRSEYTLNSCSNKEKTDNTVPRVSLGAEVSKQTGRGDIDVQAVESCDGTINWNTNSTFTRPRIFCLQHALEIEELLEGKGGVHALIICHSGRLQRQLLFSY